MWQLFTAGFTLGMISGFHCVGMCGPLALALPVQRLTRSWQFLAILLYNLGRVVTYAALGLLFGLLGRRIYIAGLQQGFSIFLGLLILGILAWRRLRGRGWGSRGALLSRRGLGGNFYRGLQGWIVRLWRSPSKAAFLLLGMANGLLPCGMVYLAIAGALSTSRIAGGVGFMAFFGAGTLPLMIGLSYSGRLISLSFRNHIKKAIPFLMGFAALLLILRGLNLGIPFISPLLASGRGPVISCH